MKDHFDIEEEFHTKDKKAFKKERKYAQANDRSRYKKSDQGKKGSTKQIPKGLRGRVLSITSGIITVDINGSREVCGLRGTLKKEKTNQRGLVTVGDFVIVDDQNQIVHIEDRYSFLSRKDNLHRRKQQLIAANIDQVLITSSIQDPYVKPSLIDRYIISTMKGNMKPIIILNKLDLDHDAQIVNDLKELYSGLGIPFIPTSTKTKEGLDQIRDAMKGKSSVFSGQSGVGKTSLINEITGSDLRIGDVVEKTGKGAHTTTLAELVPLGDESFCIDTPGIKSFSLWDITTSDILDYYSDLQEFANSCKFVNCTHTHEPDCAVKQAVESGELSDLRYQSYLTIRENNDEDQRNPWD